MTFPMKYRTGQCIVGNHPLCTWAACICECHQPAQPPAEPLTPDAAWTEQQAASRAACLERWPEAEGMGYDPRCCRFPKSCSVEPAPVDTEPLVPDDTVPVERLAKWLHEEFDSSAEDSDLARWVQESEGVKARYRHSARALMSQLPELFR